MTGAQTPTWRVEPQRTGTEGELAAELMDVYAYRLDRWQMVVVDCWLGTDDSMQYTVVSAGLAVSRQNGKNVCLEARVFYGMLIRGEKILWTAHQVRTCKRAFRRLVALFTDKRHPEITAEVKQIRFTNGEECIELVNGGSVEFMARSRQGARGYDGISLVIFDEAQELTDDQLDAIMATLSASSTGTRQLIYTGTPPYPNCPGTVFRRRRKVCKESPGAHDAWHEWSVEGKSIDEIDINNRELWYQTNPAMGVRLSEDFTAEELRTMSADGFARERLGWWSPALISKADPALDLKAWAAAASDLRKPAGKTAYGVKFSADGAEVVLAGAVIAPDGSVRISMIERKPTGHGTKWLAAWLNERYGRASCVVIDGRNGADVLVERVSDTWRAKGSIVRPSARDVCAAAGFLQIALDEGKLSWYRPQEALNQSAITSVKRPLSGGWAFGGPDAAPIEACALALWGAKTSKRDPSRQQKIG